MYGTPLIDHLERVDTLTAAGIEPPAQWVELRERHTEYTNLGNAAADQLANAVLTGKAADLPTLRALALAEAAAMSPTHAAINNHVGNAVLAELLRLYRPAAQPNYLKAADLFDSLADRLTEAVALVDPDADPVTLLAADEATRTAWATAEQLATELDQAALLLATAAELAGYDSGTDAALLALTVGTDDLDRRAVWEAWNTCEGRAGRWGSLLAAGCIIGSSRDLENTVPYRAAAPMQETWEQVGRGQYTRRMIDPELAGA